MLSKRTYKNSWTKIYGTISELINLSPEPKGEYVIVLDLNTNENSEDVDFLKWV